MVNVDKLVNVSCYGSSDGFIMLDILGTGFIHLHSLGLALMALHLIQWIYIIFHLDCMK